MNWVKRHDLTVFLVIAFALSWLAWPLVLMNPLFFALLCDRYGHEASQRTFRRGSRQ